MDRSSGLHARGAALALLGVLAAGAAGCGTTLVKVRVAGPQTAHVVLEAGVRTPEIQTSAPFFGQFETTTLKDSDAYRLRFELDANEARRYGAGAPVTLFGLLAIGPTTELGRSEVLRLDLPDELVTRLVRREVQEITAAVEDPTVNPTRKLATLTLRVTPF
jgi:hypothetical protein